jgi:6-phosphogluconolactonase
MSVKKLLRGLATASTLAMFLTAHASANSYHERRENDAVYTMSNAVEGNRVLQFKQSKSGTLVAGAQYPTGGLGTGAGLGNQGALASDGEFLFVVNAGSDDLSVFRIRANGLRLVDRIASGGIQPVSVTVDRDLVYVLNAGSDSIAGFTVYSNGRLRALPGSEQGLSGAGVGAAQIQFSQSGRTLIITEKATNSLVTFSLNREGVPVDRKVFPSPGQTPFGFALARGRQVLVSEAAGGAANASSVTSWRIRRDGSLDVLDAVVPTHQSAACWVAITPDGRFAYTTNTGSGTLSGFRVFGDGRLALLSPNGVTASTGVGSAPIDLTFSEQGEYLHVLNSGAASITTFAVGHRGQLRPVGEVSGLPAAANGLIAF